MRVSLLSLIIIISIASCSIREGVKSNEDRSSDLNQLSVSLLKALRNSNPTGEIKKELAEMSLEEVSHTLTSDARRVAFWVNIYNAFIIDILSAQPLLWEDRNAFYHKAQIPLMGRKFSFAEIEHSILRRTQHELGAGYVPKLFVNHWEKMLRVDELDYRIHFALNNGAADSPKITIYNPELINDQLNKATSIYLRNKSTYFEIENKAVVSALLLWFRGDFGGQSGIKTVINRYGVTPKEKVKITYKQFDWTLSLSPIE